MVRARPGRLSALRVFHNKSGLYGAFVKARRALNSQKRRFPARAVVAIAAVCVEGVTNRGPLGGILGPKRGGDVPAEEVRQRSSLTPTPALIVTLSPTLSRCGGARAGCAPTSS